MSVYFAIPSARPPEEALPVLRQWQERGYRVVIQRDIGCIGGMDSLFSPMSDLERCAHWAVERPYVGYPEAVNFLCRCIIRDDPQSEWIVCGGDDTLPDPNHSAEEIAWECRHHFEGIHQARGFDLGYTPVHQMGLYGVMQPTGDPWSDSQGRTIERIAGSPWIGREFARRMYGGRGPLCEEYYHCGEDEELMQVAIKYGVFWQRPDLVHHHQHWGRPKAGEKMVHSSAMPAFLAKANSGEEWQKFKRIFAERKAAGWPGSEPIA